MINLKLFIILSIIEKSFCQYFVMTPLDHSYCVSRAKGGIMNKLSVGPKMVTLKIDPKIKTLPLTETNSICSTTLIQPLGNMVHRVTDGGSYWSYWHLSIKVDGQFSSCADYLMIGEVTEDYIEDKLNRAQSSAIRLHCRSQLPTVIQIRKRNMMLWWHWSKNTQPKLTVEISTYIRFDGKWSLAQKSNVCGQSMGFWCDAMCIHGGMRCDGVNDCDSFTLRKASLTPSPDELNCHEFVNFTGVPIVSGVSYYESVWIGNSLYILLGFTILILLVSALKICMHNKTLDSRLHKSQSITSIQSSSSSSHYEKAEDEDVYEELPACSESLSKKSHSANVSLDDDTHEEVLGESSEFLQSSFNTNSFQPHLMITQKETYSLSIDTEPNVTTLAQVHSLSSSKFSSNNSMQTPLTTTTTVSLTGNILAHGQYVIARLNLPSSKRNLGNKLWKKVRTSSYDKINEGNTSSAPSSNIVVASQHSTFNSKTKSHTISRLESHGQQSAEKDDYFTSYVII